MTRHKTTPIKMKPKPSGFSFEEKSARAILRPFSHHKYIHEPPADSVVYISRRNGIVPLFRSALSPPSHTGIQNYHMVVVMGWVGIDFLPAATSLPQA